MLPISPLTAAIGAAIFLSRSNVAGLIGGGLLTMALMQLWPDTFMPIYDWVGSFLEASGLSSMISEAEQDLSQDGS